MKCSIFLFLLIVKEAIKYLCLSLHQWGITIIDYHCVGPIVAAEIALTYSHTFSTWPMKESLVDGYCKNQKIKWHKIVCERMFLLLN